MAEERFEFAFDPRYRALLLALGVTPANSRVVLSDEHFEARFGHWRLRTTVDNLKDVRVTRDYRWWKAIGPRGSFADRGLTFGTNTAAGVCVCLHRPEPGLAGRAMLHPAVTVTVADVDGLVAAVRRHLDG